MKIAPLALLEVMLLLATGTQIHSQSPDPAKKDPKQAFHEFARLHGELLTLAEREYGAEVSVRDLVFASIDGLLRNLDPHTNFLPPTAFQGMQDRQAVSFFGIGCLVSMRNGQLTVIAPIDDTPASRAGLRTGDIIAGVDGEPTEGMTLAEAVSRLKGPKGTEVEVSISRPGYEADFLVTLKRAEIPQKTVRYSYMMTPEIGYLRLTDFTRSTSREVQKALDSLRQMGMKKLLLDLRSNGGGLLNQVVEVADHFVPDGAVIVEIRARLDRHTKTFKGTDRYPTWTMPLVLLVNGGTASAAEILSGAIQDHDLGLLVGTRTWGKGLVQTVYKLTHGAGLALTTARYHTPSGRTIQRDYSSYYDYYRHLNPYGEASLSQGEQGAQKPQEVFLTGLGRTVLAGGGIAPDALADVEELSPFLQSIFVHNGFMDFATNLHHRSGSDTANAVSDQQLLADFGKWLVGQEGFSDDEVSQAFSDPSNRTWALIQVKSYIALAESGSEAAHRVLATRDTQIQHALGLFDEAAELASRRATAANRLMER